MNPRSEFKSLKVMEPCCAKWFNACPHPGPLPRGRTRFRGWAKCWRWIHCCSGVECANFFRGNPSPSAPQTPPTRRGGNAPSVLTRPNKEWWSGIFRISAIVAQQGEQVLDGAFQADINGAGNNAVADVEFHEMRHGKEHGQILVIQTVAGVHFESK